MRSTKPSRVRQLPCVIAGLLAATIVAPVHAQTGANRTNATTAAEVQRGVPGVDVDLGTNGPPASNGVPGVDVDLGSPRGANASGIPGMDVDVDTSVAGARGGAARGAREPIQDRN